METTPRLFLCAAVAVGAALLGPRLVGPQSRPAGTAFVFEPPPEFVAKKVDGGEAWVHEEHEFRAAKTKVETSIVLTHTTKTTGVDETELARLVPEMPQAFEGKCVWKHRRHEMRVRGDGARVGLIEGDCDAEIDLAAVGLPNRKVQARKLQLIFPDDTGTSIVTASYPTEQAPRWEPLLEATIAKARGVALRVPPPPTWMQLAFAAGGAVIAWFGVALLRRKAP